MGFNNPDIPWWELERRLSGRSRQAPGKGTDGWGTGMITALALLALVVEKGRPLSELRRIMQRLPQVLVNVPVATKPDVTTVPALAAAIASAEKTLGDRGRVLVRYSGTEYPMRQSTGLPIRTTQI